MPGLCIVVKKRRDNPTATIFKETRGTLHVCNAWKTNRWASPNLRDSKLCRNLTNVAKFVTAPSVVYLLRTHRSRTYFISRLGYALYFLYFA